MLPLLASLVVRLLYRFRVVGRARVPRVGGCLVVANRVGPLDRLMLRAACPRRLRILPDAGFDAKEVAAALDRGEAVLLFPEGEATRSGHLRPFRPDVEALLAATTGDVAVVPVATGGVWGTRFSYAGGPLGWRSVVGVAFGEPLPKATAAAELRLAVEELRADLAVALSDHTPLVHRAFVRNAVAWRNVSRPCVIDRKSVV